MPLIKFKLRYLALLLLLMWIVEIVNFFLGHTLVQYGILPRTQRGVPGIALSPFIHAGFQHLIANTVPLAILGGFLLTGGAKKFVTVSLSIILIGGAGVWGFGRPAFHVGASGLIFGYFGYLVFRGWYSGSLKSLFLAGLTVFIYGGLIWGVLPASRFISWEGHLFGFIAGALSAKFEKNR